MLLLAVSYYSGYCAFGFQELSSLVVNPDLLADWWYTASTAAAAAASPSLSLDEVCFTVANLLDPTSSSRQQPPRIRPFPPLRVPVLEQGWSPKIFAPASSHPPVQSSSAVLTRKGAYVQYDYDTQPISRTLVLTRDEQELFRLIQDVRDRCCPDTTVRVAGGWVRDKLLALTAANNSDGGSSSSPPRDIDFVLSDRSGSDFARLFYSSLIERGLIQHPDNDDDDPQQAYYKGYGSSSSQQSQHLQTASIQFRGFAIDFGNLRFEKYSRNSRVPEKTGIASVVQDAWRRDLTINSLFYNVNTNQVEDWTEQGLHDLEFRTIATPMAQPLATLLEDPLRILRAIRFAAQLSFRMDPALQRAALDPRVRQALRQKVSRQRVGNEMDAVFQTKDPTRGVELLLETNLVDVIFPLKDYSSDCGTVAAAPSAIIYETSLQRLSRTQALVSRIFVKAGQWNESRRRLLWYAAFLEPFASLGDATTTLQKCGLSKRSRRDGSILYQLLTNGLKRPASDAQSIEKIIQGSERLRIFVEKHEEELTRQSLLLETGARRFETTLGKDDLADLRWDGYRILKQVGPLWRESLILLLATVSEYDPSEAIQRYRRWVAMMEDQLGLDDGIFDKKFSKPLLNGSQLQQSVLPRVHGEDFKRIMEAQEEWQVRNFCSGAPDDDTDRGNREAALIDYLVHKFPEYT